jgi:phosphoribosylformylglycinamidine (FGAM) synthase-like enzyme
VRVHGTKKALAITTDCTPRYVYADPVEGGKQAVAETYRNLCAVGAKPLAITNCLNFGNPQRPEIMAQFVGALQGMGEACRALDYPIVSGNVSLYNESKATGGGSAILPTPAIGGVGLLEDWEKSTTIALRPGQLIFHVGRFGAGHLGRSLWLREIRGSQDGPPPPVDLVEERRVGEFVRSLINKGITTVVHDCSDGGMLVALAEMALAGNVSADIDPLDWQASRVAQMFGEDQARYLIAVDENLVETLREEALAEGIYLGLLGLANSAEENELVIAEQWRVRLSDLRAAHEGFFPKLMGADAALA